MVSSTKLEIDSFGEQPAIPESCFIRDHFKGSGKSIYCTVVNEVNAMNCHFTAESGIMWSAHCLEG
jgi:hypothetical protein